MRQLTKINLSISFDFYQLGEPLKLLSYGIHHKNSQLLR